MALVEVDKYSLTLDQDHPEDITRSITPPTNHEPTTDMKYRLVHAVIPIKKGHKISITSIPKYPQ